MGFDLNTPTKATPSLTPNVKEAPAFDLEAIKKQWLEGNEFKEKLVCLLLGSDGVGKSGIFLDYMTDEDIKAGKRCLVIDLDNGNMPLIMRQHKARCEKLGRDVKDVYLVRNPLEMNIQTGEIDYIKTFHNIKEAYYLAKNSYKELNLKFIAYDGLSTALKYAEYQMRLEKNIDADGGIMTRFWLIRNKIFKEILDQIKSLPISSFFVAHEDFILKADEKNASIKEATNSLMHQKIYCERIENKLQDTVSFKATITKSKYKAESEGASFTFLKVNPKEKIVDWNTKEIFKALL